jgi:hypothetical protein
MSLAISYSSLYYSLSQYIFRKGKKPPGIIMEKFRNRSKNQIVVMSDEAKFLSNFENNFVES